jgi:hypothetical protein
MITKTLGTSLATALVAVASLGHAVASPVIGQGAWATTLLARDLDGDALNGPEAYYDTVQNITWLADASFAKTSGFDADGLMTWDVAANWAAGLNIGGVTGWRLPAASDLFGAGCNTVPLPTGGGDCGYLVDVRASELAHLHYVTLGNGPIPVNNAAYPVQNTGPFTNVEATDYWTGLSNADGTSARYFRAGTGLLALHKKEQLWAAWAVHDGDVAAVPEPSSYALFFAGVVCLGLARHTKRR